MNRQRVEGLSEQAVSHPEGRRPAPRCRPLLLLLVGALVGIVVGALGMRSMGMRHEATQDADERSGSQRDTRASAIPGARTDEAGRGEAAGPSSDEHKRVSLTDKQITQLGIAVAVAAGGHLPRSLTLPGSVALNTDRLVHLVPRLPGVVRDVRKTLGETVRAGEVLAVIDSRELAD